MKRIGKLYPKIYSMKNLILADEKAQKGKSKQYGVQIHNKNKDTYLLKLHEMLKDKTYSTFKYDIFKVYEPKEISLYHYYS